jgi:hypothetical protein
VRQTAEQRQHHDRLVALVRPALGERVRITRDVEGFSIAPGRLGRLEYLGRERDGRERLYVFTARPRVIAKLALIPGVHRHQVGNGEARLWLAAGDVDALRAVARIVRTRLRRAGSAAGAAALERARVARATARDVGMIRHPESALA